MRFRYFRFIVGAALVVVLLVLSVISVEYVKNTVAAEDIFLPITIGEGEPLVLARSSTRNLAPGDVLTVNCAGTSLSGEQSSPLTVIIRCNGGATPLPTATSVIAPTATLVPPTATLGVPPTATAVVVATATTAAGTPAPTAQPATMLVWHAPGAHDGLNVHEHGPQPQAFFEAWSVQEFGHGIQFGGDEASSPMENTMKHQAFKFIVAKSDAGGDVLLRYHAASNPADRAARYHSYEVYYRDVAGNISFWQGWYDTGDPATDARCPRRSPILPCENQRPIILVVDQTAWNNNIRGEQWYMFGSPQGGWSWDMGLTILNATTFYKTTENATAMDASTWALTGDKGLQRRSDGFWYRGRGGGGTVLTGWFCAEPLGRGISAGSKTCAPGSLPQFIASTLAADARPDGFGNTRIGWLIQKTFTCAGCQVPN